MAARSILEIDVEDSKFKAFHALFEKYQSQVAKLPGAWGKSDEIVKETGASFLDMTAALLAQQELLKHNEDRHEKIRRSSVETGRTYHSMARDTGAIAKNIGSATTSLLKWAGLTSVFGGLLSAGGLFGIDRLAQSAAGQRRSAQGLGLSTNTRSAFDINYGRVLDTGSFLGNVNDALHDSSKRWILGGAGLGENDIRGQDTAGVSSALLPHLKQIADQTPDAQLAQVMQARGLDQILSLQDMQRLKAQSPADMAKFAAGYGKDKNTLSVADDTNKAWQDFTVQMTRAGATMEKVFITDLGPLAKPISDVSAAFTDLVDALLTNKNVKQWIVDLADGLEHAAKYIGTDAFTNDARVFADGVGKLADAVVDAGRSLGIIGSAPSAAGSPGAPAAPLKGDPRSLWYKTMVPGGTDIDKAKFIADQEKANGLPRGFLDRAWYAESGRGANAGMSSAGALGDFQFMKNTADQYGVTDRRDFFQSAEGSGKYYKDLIKQFGGDYQKAAAAYNWGPGNLQKAIDANGADWKRFSPPETQRYVDEVARGKGVPAGAVSVIIQNNTGGNAIVSTSQVAQ
jgi:soluble lytic murein transglycosylase-like protein